MWQQGINTHVVPKPPENCLNPPTLRAGGDKSLLLLYFMLFAIILNKYLTALSNLADHSRPSQATFPIFFYLFAISGLLTARYPIMVFP